MAEFSGWNYATAFSPTSIPVLPSLSLSDSEKATIAALQSRAQHDRTEMMLANSFYMGEEIIRNLAIALPDALAQKLLCLVGWPRIAVDPYVERLGIDGFRLPGRTDVDERLQELWFANGLDAEQSLAFTDALSMARGYWLVGSGDSPGDLPRITVESPLNMAVLWDLTGRSAKAALQSYMVDDQRHAALLMRDRTVQIAENERKEWEVVSRDPHGFGRTGVHRMANNPRSYNRDGYSEVTPELRSIVTSACRRMMGLEVASEIYSVPRMILAGAQESDFQNPNGEMRKAWDTYINLVLALERDEDGNVPELKQMTAYDPATFTKVIEMYASQAAGILAATPQDLGLYTQGNPTSAEAAAVNEARRDRRAVRKQKVYGVDIVGAMQDGMRWQNKGELPREFERIAADWADVAIKTPGVTSDAITKQILAKAIPATSDVTLKHLGYSAVERQQLEQDRGEQVPNDIVSALRNAATTSRQPATPPQPVTDGNPV